MMAYAWFLTFPVLLLLVMDLDKVPAFRRWEARMIERITR